MLITEIKGLSQPAKRALAARGLIHLSHLTEITEKELSKLHGMGPKALRQLKEALDVNGLRFKAE